MLLKVTISYNLKKAMVLLQNKKITSYGIGLLQTKAYRLLNTLTAEYLAPYNLTPIDWAFLGIIYDAHNNQKDISQKQVAEVLGTSEAFIAKLVKKMSDQKYISQEKVEEDKRMRLLILQPRGISFIEKHEPTLRNFMRSHLKGISHIHLLGYLKTIEALAHHEKSSLINN